MPARSRLPAALLLVGALTGMIASAPAHDAGVAAITIVHQPPNGWRFELQTPLHGLDRSMRRFDAAGSNELGEPDAGDTRYKELVVEYVKANFGLEARTADGDAVPGPAPGLGEGRIKLGDHVSVLIFEIENMPAKLDELTLRLPYMADEAGQRNVLWLVDGDRRERHVLGADDNFSLVDTDFFGPKGGS